MFVRAIWPFRSYLLMSVMLNDTICRDIGIPASILFYLFRIWMDVTGWEHGNRTMINARQNYYNTHKKSKKNEILRTLIYAN